MNIVVLESLSLSKKELENAFNPVKELGHSLTIYEDNPNEKQKKERVQDADILVIANGKLSSDVIKEAKNLKYIAVAFTGVDHVDLDTCKELGIKVSNAAGYSTESVSELTFGLIISLLRNIVPLDEKTRQGKTKEGYNFFDLHGKTLGVIGTGDIGSKVSNIGLAFGCKVIAYNRSEKKDLKKKGIEYVELDRLLKESDIITLHIPYNKETKHLINKDNLNLMKKSAFIINTARGPIIDNDALAKALKSGTIAGAGIDVFDIEPPLSKDNPLLDTKNSVVLPHIGFFTKEAMIRRANITNENIESFLKNKQKNVIL